MRIAIADDNLSYLKMISGYLSRIDEFEVVGVAANGVDACNIIQNGAPDIVVMDIAMPQLGGLGVLEKMNSAQYENRPQVIIVTALGQEVVSRLAFELGADFFMLKPVDMNELVHNIRYLHKLKEFKDISLSPPQESDEIDDETECQIKNLLQEIGVPNHLKGYGYIVYALKIVLKDLSSINAMKKQIYSRISDKFNTIPERAERDIRNAIEITFNRGDFEMLDRMFGLNGDKTKPSNSEFFIKLASEMLNKRGPKNIKNLSIVDKLSIKHLEKQ